MAKEICKQKNLQTPLLDDEGKSITGENVIQGVVNNNIIAFLRKLRIMGFLTGFIFMHYLCET